MASAIFFLLYVQGVLSLFTFVYTNVNVINFYLSSKSGRKRLVRSNDCSNSH